MPDAEKARLNIRKTSTSLRRIQHRRPPSPSCRRAGQHPLDDSRQPSYRCANCTRTCSTTSAPSKRRSRPGQRHPLRPVILDLAIHGQAEKEHLRDRSPSPCWRSTCSTKLGSHRPEQFDQKPSSIAQERRQGRNLRHAPGPAPDRTDQPRPVPAAAWCEIDEMQVRQAGRPARHQDPRQPRLT